MSESVLSSAASPGATHVVTGAFGYTGRWITRRLLAEGKRVRTLVHDPTRINPFGDRVTAVPYRFDDAAALAQSLEGAAVLYNTYWIRFARGRVTFEEAVANSRMLIRACEASGVSRIVHVSITNASEDSPLPYFRGKGAVERAIRESSLSYAILRPTVIFGPGDILINNIAWFLRHMPIFPVMGDGTYRVQCVGVEDLAEIAVNAGASTDSAVMDVVGPETHTYDGLVRLIARTIGSRAGIVHTPPSVARVLAAAAGVIIRDVVLTRDEITGLMANLLISAHPPLGRERLSEWVAQNRETLGRTYASELDRHYRPLSRA